MASNNTFGVSTVIRDDFFNDPFFKDWWADFEAPKSISVGRSQLERHSEGKSEDLASKHQSSNLSC